MALDNDAALKRLNLLLGEDGALKIITPFHACAARYEDIEASDIYGQSERLVRDADIAAHPSGKLAEQCRAYAQEHGHTAGMAGGYRSTGHYILAPVKRIEPIDGSASGWYTAYADDAGGNACSGSPAALLARLTEHEGG